MLPPELLPQTVRLKTSQRLVIGIPTYWLVPYTFIASLADMMAHLQTLKVAVDIVVISKPYIDMARNDIVRSAVEKKADWILFLDQDMTFPRDLFDRLAAHRKEVVGGIYFQKMPPHPPLLYDFVGTKPGADDWLIQPRLDYEEGLVKCGAIGMGATLIAMSAIRKVVDYQMNKMEPRMQTPEPFKQYAPVGEDIWFARFCAWAGVDVYCDTSIKLGHVGLTETGEVHHKLSRRYGSHDNMLDVLNFAEDQALTKTLDDRPEPGVREVADLVLMGGD